GNESNGNEPCASPKCTASAMTTSMSIASSERNIFGMRLTEECATIRNITSMENGVKEPDRLRHRSNIVLWAVFIGSAILLFELTAQPVLSVPILCAKFGWEDFRTAWWLWRSDPYRARGRTHFWLFLANGLLRIVIFAAVLLGAWIIPVAIL